MTSQTFLELNNEVKIIGEDGFYQLDKDREAVKSYMEYVEKRKVKFKDSENRIKWLVENNYYYADMLNQYTMEQIKALEKLVYGVTFEWGSFMAISKFYKSYALKTRKKKKILEDYQDRIVCASLYLGKGDYNDAVLFAIEQILQTGQPATPIFMNAGKARRGEMISCFLTQIDDSLNAITFNWRMVAELSKRGGGVANNISKMRASSEAINGEEGAASGVIPNMKVHEDIASYINQLGQRDGAFADYLNINHPDLIQFLDVKKINADEKVKMTSLSIGAIVPSIFFEKAFADEDWYFFYPLSVREVYGVHMDDMDMDEMYEVLLADERIKKEKCELSARELLNKFATMQIESGYPYMFYKSNANRNHPLKRLGKVDFSNLCTEIAQMSKMSIYNDYGVADEINYDIQCCLASINLVNAVELGRVAEVVDMLTKLLTNVLSLTDIPNAPAIMKANKDLRAIGIGQMNLMGLLAKNGVAYESEDGREIAELISYTINYHSLRASMLMSMKTGSPFVGFGQSDYADGSYFEYQGYLTDVYAPSNEKVAEVLKNVPIPTPDMMKELMEDVMKYGLYHAYRLAIAPTQSISYVQNSTSSIMPNTQIIENRTMGDTSTYYPMPYLDRKSYPYYFKTAYNMNQKRIIDMVARIQKHVDQAISCILFVNSDTPTEELGHYLAYAHYKELKSIYYVRTKNSNIADCEACSV